LFESSPLPIIELDAEGMVLRWNRGAEETFGWASENAVGKFNPIVPEDELDAFDRLLNQLLAGEEVRGAEVVGQTNAGKRVEFLLSATPVSGPDGPQSVIAVLNDITTQERMERRLRELQETAQQLSVSPSIDTVGEIATEAANNVLGLGVTGLWRYDEREQALRPVTITTAAEDMVAGAPTFTPGNSLAWDAFDAGEVRTYEDLWNVPERYNRDTKIRSEIIVPIGEQGIFITGSTEPREFSKADMELFRILGATVEAALVRATREQQLRRQNDRLEEFADVLAHDLRNPLTTAQGFLELGRESGDPDQFERVESAHDRIGQLIDDLLTLARSETVVTAAESVDIAEATEEAWLLVDTDGASLQLADPPTADADPGRLRQLFENLFRNAVEHGSTSSQTQSDDAVEHGPTSSGHRPTTPLKRKQTARPGASPSLSALAQTAKASTSRTTASASPRSTGMAYSTTASASATTGPDLASQSSRTSHGPTTGASRFERAMPVVPGSSSARSATSRTPNRGNRLGEVWTRWRNRFGCRTVKNSTGYSSGRTAYWWISTRKAVRSVRVSSRCWATSPGRLTPRLRCSTHGMPSAWSRSSTSGACPRSFSLKIVSRSTASPRGSKALMQCSRSSTAEPSLAR